MTHFVTAACNLQGIHVHPQYLSKDRVQCVGAEQTVIVVGFVSSQDHWPLFPHLTESEQTIPNQVLLQLASLYSTYIRVELINV